MAVGFILITTKPGFETSVRDALEKVALVSGKWTVFGEYDVFVKIECAHQSFLSMSNTRT